MNYVELLIIPYMVFFSRQAGGGLWADKVPTWLPEVLFSVPFAFVAWEHWHTWYAPLLTYISTYFAHNTGHGTALAMGEDTAVAQGGRKQFLSHIVDPICNDFKWPLGSLPYCLLFFAIKGLWIGISLGWYAISLAILWPLSYYTGYKILRNKYGEIELLSGLSAGVILWLNV